MKVRLPPGGEVPEDYLFDCISEFRDGADPVPDRLAH
jgi:hypothetical protein